MHIIMCPINEPRKFQLNVKNDEKKVSEAFVMARKKRCTTLDGEGSINLTLWDDSLL